MVRASDNGQDAFIAGLSKGGHISLSYACVRPSMLRAAASLDEFMGLTSNIPSAPLPVMLVEGTLDTARAGAIRGREKAQRSRPARAPAIRRAPRDSGVRPLRDGSNVTCL